MSKFCIESRILEGIQPEKDKHELQGAFEEMYRCYFPLVSSYVLSNSGTEDDAKEAFQEGAVRLYLAIVNHKIKVTNPKSYFLSICRNIWRDAKIKAKKESVDRIGFCILQEEPEPITGIGIDEKDQLNYAMSQLDELCQKVLVMRYFKRLSLKAVASNLGFHGEASMSRKLKGCSKKLAAIYNEIEA